MKVETNKKEKVFEPIELTITIENIDELKYLCALTNINENDVQKTDTEPMYNFNLDNVNSWDLWSFLDKNLKSIS